MDTIEVTYNSMPQDKINYDKLETAFNILIKDERMNASILREWKSFFLDKTFLKYSHRIKLLKPSIITFNRTGLSALSEILNSSISHYHMRDQPKSDSLRYIQIIIYWYLQDSWVRNLRIHRWDEKEDQVRFDVNLNVGTYSNVHFPVHCLDDVIKDLTALQKRLN